MSASLSAPSARRLAGAVGLAFAVLASQVLALPAAQAADRTPLIVVGTSDVYDSNLVQDVIEPEFEAAYPQYDLQYVSKGTGAAIEFAQAGSADALLVHAASLENQFVAEGYSQEGYGRAIFWGDYVLLGPANDPAGVLTSAPHDIATAFERIAAAGEAGTANFVSRGGTPGTTVQEHAIWSLTSGQRLCTMSDANGGGTSPSTTSGACPNTISYPSWYHATGLTQAPNIVNADVCNYSGGGCYVFTDRGTFNYLQSQNSIHTLGIVTRDNADSARGTSTALVNSFHAYAISASTRSVNTAGAVTFLNWITSAPAQSSIGAYLGAGGDAPFIPSAAPIVTASAPPSSVVRGGAITVTGTLKNATPGTPALADKTVTLTGVSLSTPDAAPAVVASTRTDATGAYSIAYSPSKDLRYAIAVPSISQVENASLSPVFGDVLAAATTSLGTVIVTTKSTATISSVKVSKKHSGLITVTLSPKAAAGDGVIALYGRNSKTTTSGLHVIKTVAVGAGTKTVKIRYQLGAQKHAWKRLTWKLQVKYSGPHSVASTSAKKTVTLH
ncbi:substrate-binding domain-containing protein [Galbitalea sp. SE-J8]|uniref:substrate-binding domain-containing protein n=1 Tax=Galbitalea sp. SE-J8 TaxID=3054952 RepID=UPI00259CF56C|nr:substrate-binding domain-containing protein [Galbitalea sp. SE-J8]MDM4762870.1 substrate-binding domain-containing protein [Galbitalea sp. SE-J8]